MEEIFQGDRECPECEKISLVEYGTHKWRCLNCGAIFDEDYLDDAEE